ncbi:MAG: Na(+)/H(+) antiporter subunit D [Myxococcales bacterium FL481]|nr:MAG: Na(+)/H(+) antiporter subunit D [Myxococcales bacterium FL481]
MIEFPPGLILVVGALLMPLLRGGAWKAASLLLPLAALWGVWSVPDSTLGAPFLDYELWVVHINPPTRVFATIFALMAFGGAVFALNQDRRVEVPAAFVYSGSAIGVTFAGDLITLFLFWELMAVGSTIVVWSGFTNASRKAGLRYVNVHLVGGVIMMAGIIFHVQSTGSIALTNFSALDSVGAWLILIGILINAGTPPFGGWLPDAYPEASESGTVFLSAFTTKTSVYVLMVLFAGTELLIYTGCLMAVYGIVYAILENDMRRILAYSIVNQVGFMVCAIGIGTELSLNGAAAHAFAHIIYKALLLMSAGSVLYMTGKRKCTDLGGLYHSMPLTMWCGIIGALAISAFPLTSGFTTKSMISDAAAREHLTLAWSVLTAASAGVFLHAGIKFPWFVFFQKDSGLRPPDPPLNMKLAMVFFAALCIALGIYPAPLYAILPFPAPEGEVLYAAYTGAHVVSQLQLLLFAGLAFFVLLPMLKRTLTITLDFDWLYRKLAPGIWEHILLPALRALEPVHRFVVSDLPRLAAATLGASSTNARTGDGRSVGVGPAVLVLTVFLLLFVVLNLLDPSAAFARR